MTMTAEIRTCGLWLGCVVVLFIYFFFSVSIIQFWDSFKVKLRTLWLVILGVTRM